MPDHGSPRLKRMAGGLLPQDAVAETKYEIDASIGEDPVPFMAIGWPLEQPNALDEFLESRHRLAFTQLHGDIPSLGLWPTVVEVLFPVLNESDAEGGLGQAFRRLSSRRVYARRPSSRSQASV